MDLYAYLTPRVSSAKSCRGIKCIRWGGKEDDCITMPSSLDYLGRSWGGQNSMCGVVRSRTGKCTTNADAVWTEDRNFWRGAGRGQKFSARDISSHNHKTDAIFFDLFYEVFPKQKWKRFRNKNWTILKRKYFCLDNICDTKVELFLKRKYFHLQTKVKVFPKGK